MPKEGNWYVENGLVLQLEASRTARATRRTVVKQRCPRVSYTLADAKTFPFAGRNYCIADNPGLSRDLRNNKSMHGQNVDGSFWRLCISQSIGFWTLTTVI